MELDSVYISGHQIAESGIENLQPNLSVICSHKQR